MDLPIEPLESLPKQPLKSPTGARLVLCGTDAGYPDRADSSSPARGRWFDNIAGTDAKVFLQAAGHNPDHPKDWWKEFKAWKWPAVVLMPEEYNLRVGGMSVAELRSKLEEYWGRGGVPGAVDNDSYQDQWVPAWATSTHRDPYDLSWHNLPHEENYPLDPVVFSCWVNGECVKWLNYFIAKNHTLGVVHAWFAAFLGVTRFTLSQIASSLRGSRAGAQDPSNTVSRLKFRLSFDVCMKGYDEAVDGLPSIPLDIATTQKNGVQVISEYVFSMCPRRIWDICANTVIPTAWFYGPKCPISGHRSVGAMGVRPISHAWVAGTDLTFIMTEANQHLWPIPLPRGTQVEDVRQEMIRLGVRYAWLDVLCLRQQTLAKNLAIPVSRELVATVGFTRMLGCLIPQKKKKKKKRELVERREQRRLEEWKTDVPTIGAVYSNPRDIDIYGGGPVVIFMNGLGRPFQDEGWASERHWLNRAWTLQETPPLNRCLIAGLPEGVNNQWDDSGSVWPWNCKVCTYHFKSMLLN